MPRALNGNTLSGVTLNKNKRVNFIISTDEFAIIEKLRKKTGWNESEGIRFCINFTNSVLSAETIEGLIEESAINTLNDGEK